MKQERKIGEIFIDSENFNPSKTIIVIKGTGESEDCRTCCYNPCGGRISCSGESRVDREHVFYQEARIYYDKNSKVVESGSVIDLHQTVNGQSKFVVLSLYPLDIRYAYDLSKKYEYDSEKLLIPDEYSNVEFEILGSLKISLVIEGEIINTFDYKTITI